VPLLVEYIVAVLLVAIATQLPLPSVAREYQTWFEEAAPPADHEVPLLVDTIVAVPELIATQLPLPSVAREYQLAAEGAAPPADQVGAAIVAPTALAASAMRAISGSAKMYRLALSKWSVGTPPWNLSPNGATAHRLFSKSITT
jgi:cell division septation protein DedD